MNQTFPADYRQREAELVGIVKSNKMEPGVRAVCELLQERLERTQRQFLTCSPDEFLMLQARAAAAAQLLKEIND